MRKLFTAFILLLCATCVACAANYLTFTAEEDSSTFGIDYYYLSPDVQYSLDGGASWAELTVRDTILLAKKGDKAHIRGYNEGGLGSNGKDYVHFVMTGAIAASGSVMSLIDGIGLSLKIPKESCFWYLFENCTSLTQAPEVPATTLSEWCYYGMFSGCTSLTQAPELPATTLADWCYRAMFSGCTSLTQAPELPATTLADWCYRAMFSGCTSLTKAPELPATTLTEYCYNRMFEGCTSLTQAPELPATEMTFYCYNRMFSGCTSLTQAPELPATTLFENCYSGMFSGCTSLTRAPELPATTLAGDCYSGMFSGCTSLSRIRVSFDDWNRGDYTAEWVIDVAPTGTFICPKALALEYGWESIPEGWTVKYNDEDPDAEPDYLTFTAEEDSSTITATDVDADEEDGSTRSLSKKDTDLQYSTDGGKTWNTLENGVALVMQKAEDSILFKGYNPKGFSTKTNRVKFEITGKVAASGSVMSLIDESGSSKVIPDEYCFANLFEGCAGLTQMPNLTAVELQPYCYKDMFKGCTSLTKTTALPASNLEEGSYNGMFSGCEILSEVKVEFSDWADGTDGWLHDVAPAGTFICPMALAEEYGTDRIPEGWTVKYNDGNPTDVPAVTADVVSLWTEGLTIIVSGATGRVEVFDASGARLKSESSVGGACTFTMPAHGVYLVRTSKRTVKVVL